MTRDELRARIRGEVERQGYAAVSWAALWAAFNAPGEDAALPFDEALRGFAAMNGWRVQRSDSPPFDTFVFLPRERSRRELPTPE